MIWRILSFERARSFLTATVALIVMLALVAAPPLDQQAVAVPAQAPSGATGASGATASVASNPPPPVPANSGTGRRIIFSTKAQRVWLVEANGTIARSHAVSGHALGRLPALGQYRVFSKSPWADSLPAAATPMRMQWMVRFTATPTGAIGFHAIPIDATTSRPVQLLSALGRRRSGGCIRQAPGDAEFLYRWASVGTRVVVI